MAVSDHDTGYTIQEDTDAVWHNGARVLTQSGVVGDDSLKRSLWQVVAIDRVSENYAGIAVSGTGTGHLTASITDGGIAWSWQALNSDFDFLEDDRSVSELFDFVAEEIWQITYENELTGEIRSDVVTIAIEGNSDESFDVLVLGSDNVTVEGTSGVQRVADNLVATGLVDSVESAEINFDKSPNFQRYEAILAYTNTVPADAQRVGNDLRDYVDRTDGGVVLANFAFSEPWTLAGGIVAPSYSSFVLSDPDSASPTAIDGLIPTPAGRSLGLFDGVDTDLAASAIRPNSNFPNPELTPQSVLLASDENGIPLLAQNQDGRVISANIRPRDNGPSNLDPNGDSLLDPAETELYELLVSALYTASDDMKFTRPTAAPAQTPNRQEEDRGITYDVFEAEFAAFEGSVSSVAGRGASGGQYVDFLPSEAASAISWVVEISESGFYAIDTIYSLAASKAPRPLTLLVNGEKADQLPFVANSNEEWTDWADQHALIELPAGRATLTLRTEEGRGVENGANIDYLRVSASPVSVDEVASPETRFEVADGRLFRVFEAETAYLDDAFVLDTGRNSSGGVFVDFPATDEPLTITWRIDVLADGVYTVDFLYALSMTKSDRPLAIYVDGEFVENLAFEAQSDPSETIWTPESIDLALSAGSHDLSLVSPADAGIGNGANIDYLRISSEPQLPPSPEAADDFDFA